MTKTFREALIEATASGGPSLRSVAEGAGVSYEQLKKVRQGKTASTNVDDAVRVARYLGKTLDQFLEDPAAQQDAEIVDLWQQLSPDERRFLRNAAKAQIAARGPSPETNGEDSE